jgi:hypothetical protein
MWDLKRKLLVLIQPSRQKSVCPYATMKLPALSRISMVCYQASNLHA